MKTLFYQIAEEDLISSGVETEILDIIEKWTLKHSKEQIKFTLVGFLVHNCFGTVIRVPIIRVDDSKTFGLGYHWVSASADHAIFYRADRLTITRIVHELLHYLTFAGAEGFMWNATTDHESTVVQLSRQFNALAEIGDISDQIYNSIIT